MASSEQHRPQQQQQQPGSPRASGAESGSVPPQDQLPERLSSASTTAVSDSSSSRDMAATKAELLLSALQISDPLSCIQPSLSPLDGYSKLEELTMLLQNAAAGGSLLEGAGLLGGEPGEYGGE